MTPPLLAALRQLGGAALIRQLAAACDSAAVATDPGKAGGDSQSRRWERAADHPELLWGRTAGRRAMVSRLYREQPRPGITADARPRLSSRAAAATPPAFARELIRIALSAPWAERS